MQELCAPLFNISTPLLHPLDVPPRCPGALGYPCPCYRSAAQRPLSAMLSGQPVTYLTKTRKWRIFVFHYTTPIASKNADQASR